MEFSDRGQFLFVPDDEVLDIYRSIYGGRIPFADSMECEMFVENLAVAFELPIGRIADAWHEEVTLGELFGHVSA